MIKQIKNALLLLCLPAHTGKREFNDQLLDQHREDAYALVHQQMFGFR